MADTAMKLSAVPNAKPFSSGYDPRRGRGPVSAAEREFRRLVDAEHIPAANALLRAVYKRAMKGDMRAAELFLKACGLIRKPTDDAAIHALASQLLDGMLREATARRSAELQAEGRPIDVGTDE
jgi:hypothetical protein